MTPTLKLLAAYSVAIVASSVLGGVIPSLVRLTHVRMQCLLSLVGGFVLGIALLHMIPHGVSACGSLDLVVTWTLIGLLGTFFLIRLFHFHQHDPETQPTDDGVDCSNPDHKHHHHDHAGGEVRLGGVLFGLSLHSLMDGIALGAAVVTDAQAGHHWPYGFGVFLAVLLHKPLDALSVTGTMASGAWTERSVRLVNFLFSFVCPIGAFLFVCFAESRMSGDLDRLLGMGLGFSAGAFLCISLSDLLPEVQFHRHDRGKLSVSLLLGVALAYGTGFLEGGHAHDHHRASEATTSTHDAADDDFDDAEGQDQQVHDHHGHDHSHHSH